MGFFSKDNRDDVYDSTEHKSSWTHEAIGGAIGYEAFKKYEEHKAANGTPDSHAKAKEILVGLAAAEADKLFETKGLDFIDREKAKHEAKKHAEEQLAGGI